MPVLWGLPLLSILAACEAPKPVIQYVPEYHNVYPTPPPATNLTCIDEPQPGQVITDVQAMEWAERVRIAGLDCRNKLGAVRQWIISWPK